MNLVYDLSCVMGIGNQVLEFELLWIFIQEFFNILIDFYMILIILEGLLQEILVLVMESGFLLVVSLLVFVMVVLVD